MQRAVDMDDLLQSENQQLADAVTQSLDIVHHRLDETGGRQFGDMTQAKVWAAIPALWACMRVLTSLFTSVAVTRVPMEWRIRLSGQKTLSISGLALFDRLSDNFSSGKRVINFMRA